MSEIKITKDSLENAILKDGLFVFGDAINGDNIDSIITSSSSGAFAGGYVYDGEIGAYSFGAFANGCALNNSSIIASGQGAHAEGYVDSGVIEASGNGAHTEGYAKSGCIIANGNGAHAEGYANEGTTINASGNGAHAEGYNTIASGNYSHAEGNDTTASSDSAHAEGYDTVASSINSHAEGNATTASGINSHAEGNATTASGINSHAEGFGTTASGINSHAGGADTIANQSAMTAIGKYNKTYEPADLSTLFVVGDGDSSTSTHNAFIVSTSTNYAGYSALATVNGVSDVYLGCPIGTIVMWAGGDINTSTWIVSEEAPDGWLVCDGRLIPTKNSSYNTVSDHYEEFLNLLNVIGTKYGTKHYNTTPPPRTPYTVKNEQCQPNVYYVCIPDFTKKFPLGAGYTNGMDNTGEYGTNYFKFTAGTQEYYSNNGFTGGEKEHTLTADESGLPSHSHSMGKFALPSDITDYVESKSGHKTSTSGGDKEFATDVSGGNNAQNAHNNIPPFLAINFIIKYK